jgi:hypothetical protein
MADTDQITPLDPIPSTTPFGRGGEHSPEHVANEESAKPSEPVTQESKDVADTSVKKVAHPGGELYQKMLDAGAPLNQIEPWKQGLKKRMLEVGAPPQQVDTYWGDNPQPDTRRLDATIRANVDSAIPASDPYHAFLAGLQTSDIGLVAHGKPTTVLPPDPGTLEKILAAGGQTIPDIPVMAAGALLGGFGGAAAGGAAGGPPGAAIGGAAGIGAGGAALPELVRDILMDQYAHPEGYKTWQDFWSRAGAIAMDTGKAGLVGAIAYPLGGVIGNKMAAVGAGKVISGTANVASQAVAATVVGSSLEGHVPTADDFIVSATTMLG